MEPKAESPGQTDLHLQSCERVSLWDGYVYLEDASLVRCALRSDECSFEVHQVVWDDWFYDDL
jgi:hypothetical protein